MEFTDTRPATLPPSNTHWTPPDDDWTLSVTTWSRPHPLHGSLFERLWWQMDADTVNKITLTAQGISSHEQFLPWRALVRVSATAWLISPDHLVLTVTLQAAQRTQNVQFKVVLPQHLVASNVELKSITSDNVGYLTLEDWLSLWPAILFLTDIHNLNLPHQVDLNALRDDQTPWDFETIDTGAEPASLLPGQAKLDAWFADLSHEVKHVTLPSIIDTQQQMTYVVSKLVTLPSLESLRVVDVKTECLQPISELGLRNLTLIQINIGDISGHRWWMSRLDTLELSRCKTAPTISLASFVELTALTLSSCPTLAHLNLEGMTQLSLVEVANCKSLADIQGLDTLASLRRLKLSSTPKLEEIDGLAGHQGIRELSLGRHKQLRSFRGLSGLSALESLTLSECSNLKTTNMLAASTQLRSLDLCFCAELTDIDDLGHLTALTSLNLNGCTQLQDLSPLSKLTQLLTLKVSSYSITGVDFLSPLIALEQLSFSFCTSLKHLDGIEPLTQLKRLELVGCTLLTSIEPLSGMPHLTHLNLQSCEELPSISAVKSLAQLLDLNLVYCYKLPNWMQRRWRMGVHSPDRLTNLLTRLNPDDS